MQALKQNGVEKFSPVGEQFDPNKHAALFQIPDADKEPGTVLAVTKVFWDRSTAALLCFECTQAAQRLLESVVPIR